MRIEVLFARGTFENTSVSMNIRRDLIHFRCFNLPIIILLHSIFA